MHAPTPRSFTLFAAGIAAFEAGLELSRAVVFGAYVPGETPMGVVALPIAFALVLGFAAVGLAVHKTFGFITAVAAMALSLGYGIFVRASGAMAGIAYIFGGLLILGALMKALPYFETMGPARPQPAH